MTHIKYYGFGEVELISDFSLFQTAKTYMGTEDMVKKKPQKTVSCPNPIINHKQKIKVSAANKIASAKYLLDWKGNLKRIIK
jgi:hypothetical protein